MSVFLFIMLFLIACIPCYASYRLRNYQLLAVTVVCALLSFLFLPFLLSVILVNRKLPKTRTLPISFGYFSGYWGLLLLLFLLLPFMSAYGISMNGYQFFRLSTFSDSVSTQVVFFLFTIVLGFVLSLLLRQRALYTGELVLFLLSYGAFALLSFNLIYYRLASYGTYLLLFLYLAGIIGLYVSTACMFQTDGEARTSQEDRASIPRPLEALGTEAMSALSDAAGKIGSAVKTGLSEMKPANSVVIHCIRGVYAGADFVLKAGDQLILGTDPAQANLIFSSPEISRLHCIIRFTGSHTIQLLDASTNGTYCSNGKRLPKNQPTELSLPCTIFFGPGPEVFEIQRNF